jgi:hypothetical protein
MKTTHQTNKLEELPLLLSPLNITLKNIRSVVSKLCLLFYFHFVCTVPRLLASSFRIFCFTSHTYFLYFYFSSLLLFFPFLLVSLTFYTAIYFLFFHLAIYFSLTCFYLNPLAAVLFCLVQNKHILPYPAPLNA